MSQSSSIGMRIADIRPLLTAEAGLRLPSADDAGEPLDNLLKDTGTSFFVFSTEQAKKALIEGSMPAEATGWKPAAFCPALRAEDLGSPEFKHIYGVKYPLYAGAMANGIASEDMVVALGKAGFMGSFGAGGCMPGRIEAAIQKVQAALPGGPYAFNLIHSPLEPALEEKTVQIYLQHGIKVIEASAYLTVNRNLVHYRAAGLSQNPDGTIHFGNRIIAKLSRREVASRFLQPASAEILDVLEAEGSITHEQARLARLVPMADDITVEADSGGHTDNRPLVSVLPAIIRLRNEMQAKHQYRTPVRVGAGGGIGTPAAALAAFLMGAAYVTTGSVNQGCLESGASAHVKNLLSQVEMTDVVMAPASDMFEMGVKVQVLKRGTMFAMRGLKLYEIYQRYESVEDIPAEEKQKLEATIFKQSLDSIWEECVRFFNQRDPRQVERANQKPKDKMALIFRWYLGLSSRWAMTGEKDREMDYQIWCGPAMGAFNDWARGTYLEAAQNRAVADVSLQLLQGAAYLYRVRILEAQGVHLPAEQQEYKPQKG